MLQTNIYNWILVLFLEVNLWSIDKSFRLSQKIDYQIEDKIKKIEDSIKNWNKNLWSG